MFIPITPEGASRPIAPYVHGARAGNTIYVAGTLAIGEDGTALHVGDVRGQTRSVIQQIVATVEAGGGRIDDIAYNMIFISDVDHYAGMNEVYTEFFGNNLPARYCIIAQLVKPEFLVEIASIAHLED